jgi:hypothetical protein
VLVDCEADLAQFLKAMDLLGEKLGPLPNHPVPRPIPA